MLWYHTVWLWTCLRSRDLRVQAFLGPDPTRTRLSPDPDPLGPGVFHYPFCFFDLILFLVFEMTFFYYRNKRKQEILENKKEINTR